MFTLRLFYGGSDGDVGGISAGGKSGRNRDADTVSMDGGGTSVGNGGTGRIIEFLRRSGDRRIRYNVAGGAGVLKNSPRVVTGLDGVGL